MKIFTNLRQANRERNKEWDPEDKIDLGFRALELAGETGEACNIAKKLLRETLGLRGSRATKEQLAEELADVQICLDLLAMTAGIDLEDATIKKFNKTSAKHNLSVKLAQRTL